MRNLLISLLIFAQINFQMISFAEAQAISVMCSQTNCVPGPGSAGNPDIQEKAGFSAIDLGFAGNDISVSTIPNQGPKNIRMSFNNGLVDSAKNLVIDLSAKVPAVNASNIIVIGDNVNNMQIKLNGYYGKSGKDASQLCSDNITSLKYGADSNLIYLQNRANPANGLSADRCGDVDVANLAADKFSCADPNFVDITLAQSIDVQRIRKVSKCMSIVPQPVCVQPAYKITCSYDLWLKNMPTTQGSGDNYMNIVPDSRWNGTFDFTNRDNWPYLTPDGGGSYDLNNSYKNNILTYKDKINDGTDGMFFWDIANYLISTTYFELHDGCSSGGFGSANNVSLPYFYAYSNQLKVPFTRSSPSVPQNIYFSQSSGVGNATQINSKDFYVTQEELNLINSAGPTGTFDFCNARGDKLPSQLASKVSQVAAQMSSLESQLDGSAIAYFRRNNLNAYGGNGCNGRIFTTSRGRSDMTYRARDVSTPVVSSQGLDSTGLRLSGGFEKTPKNPNAALSYTNSQGWQLDIMSGFSGSTPSSPTCNTNFNLLSIESTNLVKYNDTIGSCSGVQSCSSTNPDPLGCQIDPNNLGSYNYIGQDADPQNRLETVNCSLTSCPVENKLLEDSRVLDTLSPTAGEDGTQQGSGMVFIYDTKNVSLQSSVGQAGAGGRNDLPSPSVPKLCVKKRDYVTDPNSDYKNNPSVEFKRINFKVFDVQGGSTPGAVPPFTGKKINLYKKLDPAVLYLLKKELL